MQVHLPSAQCRRDGDPPAWSRCQHQSGQRDRKRKSRQDQWGRRPATRGKVADGSERYRRDGKRGGSRDPPLVQLGTAHPPEAMACVNLSQLSEASLIRPHGLTVCHHPTKGQVMRLTRIRGFAVVAAVLGASLCSAGLPAWAKSGQAVSAQTSTLSQTGNLAVQDPLWVMPRSDAEGPGEPIGASIHLDDGDDVPSGPLTLSISNLPANWRVSFEPAVISAGQSSRMTIRIAERAQRQEYKLDVTAKNAAGADLHSTYFLTVHDSPWSCPWLTNRVADGGFEAGSTSPWRASSGVITKSAAQPASAGVYKAWLGQPRSGRANTLTQTITLPPTCLSYGVFFDLHIDTAEPAGAPARDQLIVLANNTVLKTYSNADARDGYRAERLDLSAFADSKVRLTFISTNDGRRRTNFVVDEVFVRATGA